MQSAPDRQTPPGVASGARRSSLFQLLFFSPGDPALRIVAHCRSVIELLVTRSRLPSPMSVLEPVDGRRRRRRGECQASGLPSQTACMMSAMANLDNLGPDLQQLVRLCGRAMRAERLPTWRGRLRRRCRYDIHAADFGVLGIPSSRGTSWRSRPAARGAAWCRRADETGQAGNVVFGVIHAKLMPSAVITLTNIVCRRCNVK